MVRADNPLGDRGGELGHGELRCRHGAAARRYPGSPPTSSVVRYRKSPFDFAAALRASDGGANELDVQVGDDLAQRLAHEIAPVMGVEDIRSGAHRPGVSVFVQITCRSASESSSAHDTRGRGVCQRPRERQIIKTRKVYSLCRRARLLKAVARRL